MSRQPGQVPDRGGRETLGRLGGLAANEADRGERALWLSGDGHRAALFHLGALTRLNELGLLAQIGTVGAVSGGSILAALLATRVPWPLHGAFRDWPEQVAEPLREIVSRNSRARSLLRRPLPAGSAGEAARAEQYARELVESQGGESRWGPRFVFGASGLTLSGLAAGWEECLEWEIGSASGAGGYPAALVGETIAAVRTDLDAFGEAERAVLENHGYLLADAALRERGMSRAGGIELAAAEPPHPRWMAPEPVREGLASSGRRIPLGRLRPRRARRAERVPERASEELTRLLRRHRPVLQYDSLESCRADSAATICDVVATGRSNSLHRADGSVVAAALPGPGEALLSLDFLGGPRYGNGEPARSGDYLDESGGAHLEDALAIRARDPAAYADVVYGHARHDRVGGLWLQYWFFYYYEDRGLLGLERREGGWEMVQLRLGADGAPEAATFAQHRGGERLRWDQVELALTEDGQAPVVYPARGSHAPLPRPGSYPAPLVADHNDGLGPRVRPRLQPIADDGPGWVLWPGRWGSTRRRERFEAESPRGPRRQPQWWDPAGFHEEAGPWRGEPLAGAAEGAPSTPRLQARLEGGLALISYGFPDGGAAAARLVAAPFDDAGVGGGSHPFAVEAPAGEVALQLNGERRWRGVRVAATSVAGVPGETVSAGFA
jgi:hypothetical protein